MKNVTQLINSPNVALKLESNSILQLDNPITSKAQNSPNPTKKILRKKGISKVSCSVEILSNLQKASVEYHKIASKSDTQLLKSDFHGAEIEVTKSKCFSLVGLKGIVVQETFSTFKIVKCSKSMKSKVIPKSSCIFMLKRNGVAQYLNGDQLICASGFRTSKKFKNKPSFYIVQEAAIFFAKTAAERTPLGVRQSIENEDSDKIGHVYANLTGLAGFVGCKKDYPPRVAFALIDKALEIFASKTSKEVWISCSRPIDSPWLKELFRIHKNPAEADSLTRVQQELDETKIVLHKTIESLLERGEKLDDLVSKSNELGILSKEFLKDSRKTNSCCVIQ